ncbi:hypothetical protein [Caballeronia cordobensis]|uniref:hypothetical protein n=1 Tax=Caballeronia cordobensis TaxID=1353886 RepID=UPI0013648B84|nr:hypothetical protein [Caballeronia cordobensis]
MTIAELEQWRALALTGLEAGLKKRTGNPLQPQLDDAVRCVGELSMENEMLRKERERQARGRRRDPRDLCQYRQALLIAGVCQVLEFLRSATMPFVPERAPR